jgi:hypothetical protein
MASERESTGSKPSDSSSEEGGDKKEKEEKN